MHFKNIQDSNISFKVGSLVWYSIYSVGTTTKRKKNENKKIEKRMKNGSLLTCEKITCHDLDGHGNMSIVHLAHVLENMDPIFPIPIDHMASQALTIILSH